MEEENQEQEIKEQDEQKVPEAKEESKKPKESKKPSKAVLISAVCSLLVIAGFVLLAQNLPKTITTTEYLEQQYIYSGKPTGESQPDDGFGNVDWYTIYDPNALSFEYIYEETNNYVKISGLKNSAVEEKINNQIRETVLSITQQTGEKNSISVMANFFNVLSVVVWAGDRAEGTLNFDLNTGEQIKFQDIYSSKADIFSIVYGAVVRDFQINYNHSLYVGACSYKNKISMMENNPDIDVTQTMCFMGNETIEGLKAERDALIKKSENIEDEALAITKSYLAQESRDFYLKGSGPVFVYNGTEYAVIARDIMDQFAFYERYRSSESLFADNSSILAKDLLLPSPFFGTDVYHRIVQEDNSWEEYSIDAPNGQEDSILSFIKSKSPEKKPDPSIMNFAGYHVSRWNVSILANLYTCTTTKSVFESKIKPEIFYSSAGYFAIGGDINSTITTAGKYLNPTKDENISCEDWNFFRFMAPDGTIYENPEDIFDAATDYVAHLTNLIIARNYSKYISDNGNNGVPKGTSLKLEYEGYGLTLKIITPQGNEYSTNISSFTNIPDIYLNPALRAR